MDAVRISDVATVVVVARAMTMPEAVILFRTAPLMGRVERGVGQGATSGSVDRKNGSDGGVDPGRRRGAMAVSERRDERW